MSVQSHDPRRSLKAQLEAALGKAGSTPTDESDPPIAKSAQAHSTAPKQLPPADLRNTNILVAAGSWARAFLADPDDIGKKQTAMRLIAQLSVVQTEADLGVGPFDQNAIDRAREQLFDTEGLFQVAIDQARIKLASLAAIGGLSLKQYATRILLFRPRRRHKKPVPTLPPKDASVENEPRNLQERSDPRVDRLRELVHGIRSLEYQTQFGPQHMSEADITLAIGWDNALKQSLTANHPSESVRNVVGKYLSKDKRVGLLLSARHAELVAKLFYSRLGCRVIDVSATQGRNEGHEWTLFDLRVDGNPIDIKNSRQNPQRPDAYPEHCVPQFKRARGHGGFERQVRIAGVFSPWLFPYSLLNPTDGYHKIAGRPTFLGETSVDDLNELRASFQGELELDFRLDKETAMERLPPWVFEYPSSMYRGRATSFAAVRELARDLPPNEVKKLRDLVPVFLAAGAMSDHGTIIENSRVRRFTAHWNARVIAGQGTLPSLFLTILVWFLKEAPLKDEIPLNPRDLLAVLYGPGTKRRPLEILDPLNSITALLRVLTALTNSLSKLENLRQYKLYSFTVLRGRTSSADAWTTLVAHCGKCGHYPLIIGEQITCECLFLICAHCQFCSNGCTAHARRIAAFDDNERVRQFNDAAAAFADSDISMSSD